MAFVTVKPKFQVTIPAKLRRGIDLREGDLMEATLVSDGILLKPKEVVDRVAAADRIAAKFAAAQPSSHGSRAVRGRDHERHDQRHNPVTP